MRCLELRLARRACRVSFGKAVYEKSIEFPYKTIRGETLVFDLTKSGRIIGFEVLNDKMKPCQHTFERIMTKK